MSNPFDTRSDGHLAGDRGSEPERRAGKGDPASSACRRCGGKVSGRRRNGWCSDACRMAKRREEAERRRQALLDTIIDAVEKLRREVLS